MKRPKAKPTGLKTYLKFDRTPKPEKPARKTVADTEGVFAKTLRTAQILQGDKKKATLAKEAAKKNKGK